MISNTYDLFGELSAKEEVGKGDRLTRRVLHSYRMAREGL